MVFYMNVSFDKAFPMGTNWFDLVILTMVFELLIQNLGYVFWMIFHMSQDLSVSLFIWSGSPFTKGRYQQEWKNNENVEKILYKTSKLISFKHSTHHSSILGEGS
jgi:hypothetical protein